MSSFWKKIYDLLFGYNPEFKSREEKTEEQLEDLKKRQPELFESDAITEFKDKHPELFEDMYIRKYVGTNPYSDHLGRVNESFYAVTYENNDTNREDELSYEIKERFHLTHIPDYGYDDNEEVDSIEDLPIFPDIEVGRI